MFAGIFLVCVSNLFLLGIPFIGSIDVNYGLKCILFMFIILFETSFVYISSSDLKLTLEVLENIFRASYVILKSSVDNCYHFDQAHIMTTA